MYKYLPAKVEKQISVLRIFLEKIRGFLWQIAGEYVSLHAENVKMYGYGSKENNATGYRLA